MVGLKVPCSRVFIKSSGCRQSVVAVPAVNPAMVSTTDDDKPSLPNMNFLGVRGCHSVCASWDVTS